MPALEPALLLFTLVERPRHYAALPQNLPRLLQAGARTPSQFADIA